MNAGSRIRRDSRKNIRINSAEGTLLYRFNDGGFFQEQDQIVELSVRIGAKRYYLQPVDKPAFDRLAEKITKLDLNNADSAAALAQANISEMGNVKSSDGSSEWDRDWEGLITPDGVNPPKIIERPEISSTPEARKARTYGKVKISGIINKNGEIQDLKVAKGLGRGLDQKALEGVKNWVFLPATKNGEVLDSAIAVEVEFPFYQHETVKAGDTPLFAYSMSIALAMRCPRTNSMTRFWKRPDY